MEKLREEEGKEKKRRAMRENKMKENLFVYKGQLMEYRGSVLPHLGTLLKYSDIIIPKFDMLIKYRQRESSEERRGEGRKTEEVKKEEGKK